MLELASQFLLAPGRCPKKPSLFCRCGGALAATLPNTPPLRFRPAQSQTGSAPETAREKRESSGFAPDVSQIEPVRKGCKQTVEHAPTGL